MHTWRTNAIPLPLLRQAFEIYKGLMICSATCLITSRNQSIRRPEGRRVEPLLALGYLHWWNDEKDEASGAVDQSGGGAEGDSELRLELAALREPGREPRRP